MTELKPCPFCGEKMYIVEPVSDDRLIYAFYHEGKPFDLETECPFYIGGFIKANSKERAIEAWNRRADDAGPVRHAKNVMEDYPSLFQCSACGWSCDDTYCGDNAYRYCPGCGAKMDEEATDGKTDEDM